MEKLFIVPISRKICRSRIILLGLILSLLLPCTLAAHDPSDLKRKAEQGDAHSQVDLGLLYENGKGVPQDYKEAAKWYLKAAEQGNASGQNNLGLMYWNGKGVPQDYNEAAKWYRKAADQGNAYGQTNLGDAYRDGKGVLRDYNEAVKWYLKAAEQGNAFGQNSLGDAYRDGKGLPQDYKEAVEWYLKAAEQGNVQAQNNLGGMHYHGKGVTRDYSEAIKWSLKSLKMKPLFLITVFFPCLFGTMALFFLVIGLRGVVIKKPFLISARWLLVVVLLGLSPAMLQVVTLPTSGDGSGILMAVRWLVPTMLIVVVIFLSFTLRGYIAFGVTDTSFRDGLLASLKKLNLAHEETLAAMRLPTIGADLQVAVQSWMGAGQMKMKQRQFRQVLGDIAKNMNEYYQNSADPKVNLTCCIFYVVMGVFMIVFAGVFLFGFSKIL